VNFNLILKYKGGIFRIISLIFCILSAESINAQTPTSDSLRNPIQEDVVILQDPEQKAAVAQPTKSLDSLTTTDTLDVPKSDIESRIEYSCRDSLRMNIAEQKVYLYGNSKVIYGTRTLDAEFLEINWATNEVKAYGRIDTTTGKTIGKPVFKDGADTYAAEEIRYNMKSGKGIIKGIVTRQGDGYIHGGPVKKTPEAIYVNHALYTTCNLPHPHFSINASRLKVIPGDKVVTGPFHVRVMGIETPLGLPLGFFPVTRRSKSGIIFPTIGEQRTRGFYLSNGGYYWAVSDYVGAKFIGDIYANKSYRISNNTIYTKRYAYNGTLAASYSSTRETFTDSVPFLKTMNLTWNHSQISNKPARFSANVNILSSKYYQSTSYNPVNLMSSTFYSSVSWSKAFRNTPFNLSIAVQQNQNVKTSEMNITAPSVSLTMNRVYIFKKKSSNGTKWFEKINVSYNGVGQWNFRNIITSPSTTESDTLNFNRRNINTILSNGQWGATHTIPIGTTIKLLKYFNLNPSINGQVFFFDRTLDHSYNNTTKQLDVVTNKGFAAAYSYNFSNSLSTRVYGTYKFKGNFLKAIRHTLIPTITYTYRPDFSNSTYNFYDHYTDSTGKPRSVSHFLSGGPGSGLQNMLTFGLVNTIEGKIRNKKDTTGTNEFKIVKLLDNFALLGSYNFSAQGDTMQWSQITMNANSRFLNKIDFAFTSSFDPYKNIWIYSTTGERIGSQRINQANKNLVELLRYSVSLSTNLNPKAKGGAVAQAPYNPNIPGTIQTFGSPYIDFTVPWNLNLRYNLIYDKLTLSGSPYTNSLTFTGDVKISDKWKIAFQSGYDFVNKGLTPTTSINLFRYLHCWQMNMSIMPFGTRQSFMFTLNAKSSLLRDLKVTKQNPNYYGGY